MSDPLTIIHGDALSSLRDLADGSVQCCVTSPPYWGLRDYGHEWQIGLEKTPEEYVARLVEVFRDLKRVLRSDGTLWLNLGDSYCGYWGDAKALAKGERSSADTNGWTNGFHMNARPKYETLRSTGLKPKDLVGIPWMIAFALRADGWYLRSDIIWSKPNPMPESVTDRPTKSHEYIFLLSKSGRYYYDSDSIREPQTESSFGRSKYGWAGRADDGSNGARTGSSFRRMAESGEPIATIPADGKRNKRSVWRVTTQSYSDAHFATFPPDLIKPCILAGAPVGGLVLDPFAGSGTTGKVAIELGRRAILIEPKAEYVEMIKRRCQTTIGLPL